MYGFFEIQLKNETQSIKELKDQQKNSEAYPLKETPFVTIFYSINPLKSSVPYRKTILTLKKRL